MRCVLAVKKWNLQRDARCPGGTNFGKISVVSFAKGEVVGSYRVLRALGRGSMGQVYEVEHAQLGIKMALKAFALEGGDREFLRKRFFAEGRVLARIRDPHVVQVVDLDIDRATDTPYFVMNLVLGPEGAPCTLADRFAKGKIAEDQLLAWYEDVRLALATVHGAGIVHRDIKPENVLLDADGRAVLSDFGVCRIVDDTLRRQLEVTRTMVSFKPGEDGQAVMGTVAYLSPEVRTGAEPSAADDFYALGVSFFRLLTGVWYAPGTNVMDLLSPFDARWKALFAALLAVDPERRAAPPVGWQKSVAFALSKKAVLGFGAGLLIAAVLMTVVWLWPTGEQKGEDLSYLDEMMYVPALSK